MSRDLIFKISSITLAIVLLGSCVSQKKYDELMSSKNKLEEEKAACNEDLTISNNQNARLSKQITDLEQDTVSYGLKYRTQLNDNKGLQTEHKKLETYYNNLLTNSGRLNRELAEQQKKVMELEQVLAEKEKAVNALKNKVSAALLNFKENDLTIQVKNGKVYVSLAEQLLFGSGSVKVDTKGESALQQLAKVLKENNDINIVVEGHTDNVPISRVSQYMNDNWDLSVMRATSIVRILTTAGVDPKRITAAGRGEFSPLTENVNPEGKQKNRRTEIILTPKLDELFQILESN